MVMTETTSAWVCPKDATAMEPMGRRGRGGAWRCPTCRGVFLDVEAMRGRRQGRPPTWAPFVMSLLMSIVMTLLIRRLRHRGATPPVAGGADGA
jgi:hypothetical protein